MKVLIVSHYFPPHMGGIEIVAEQQAKQLIKNAQEVQVLTSACGDKPGNTECSGYKLHRVRALNVFEQRMGVPFPIFSPSLIYTSYRLVRDSDVVHVHDALYLSSFAAAIWAKILKKPLFLSQHVAMIPHPNGVVNLVQKIVYGTTGNFIFHTSTKIIIFNDRVRSFLTKRGVPADKIIDIPNGVDTKLFHEATNKQKSELRRKYELPTNKTLALFVGRFVPKKGFDKLLKVKSDAYTIIFVGGNRPSSVKANKGLIFLGSLSQQAAAEVYRACDIFVLPSEGEGFPLSIQEAMASGLPIITTDDPGYALYNFNRTSLHLIKPTVEKIKTHLTQIAKDPALGKAMSKYSSSYAKKYFDWNKNIKEILKIYKETVS